MMWIDLGIDTGDILAAERTPLDGSESLYELHFKVMEHAHGMYLRTAEAMAARKTLARVRQADIDEGVTFYTRDWNSVAILQALKNFATNYRAAFTRGEAERRAAELERLFRPLRSSETSVRRIPVSRGAGGPAPRGERLDP